LNQGCLLFRENFLIEVVLNCSFRASSASKVFEVGLRSLELPLWASGAFKIFEAELRSLELFLSGQQRLQSIRGRTSVSRITSSGQQRLQDIRGGTSVPQIVSFGPAAPPKYSRQDFGLSNYLFGPAAPSRYSRRNFGPSNCFFWASSTFKIFEVGLQSLKLFLSGQQRLQDIRGRASILRVAFFGPVMPLKSSDSSCGSLSHPFRAYSITMLFENKHPNFRSTSLDC
jgi:hypothetical protein